MMAGDRLDQAIRAYQVPGPPEGLAERVASDILIEHGEASANPRRQPTQGRRWLRQGLGALACMGAGAALAALWFSRAQLDEAITAGTRAPLQRETIALGKRAVLVVERGAVVEWRRGAGGELTVAQSRGEVFYRVQAGPFAVSTPAGTVHVRGTCFRVEVQDMALTSQALKGAVVGAALASAVVVTVYEGRVSLANRQGTLEAAAGEVARLPPDQAPHLADTAARAPAEDAARLAIAAAGLRQVPQLAPAASPGHAPGEHDRDSKRATLEELPAPVRALLAQVTQGREMHKLRIKRGSHGGEPSFNVDFFIDGTNHELEVNDQGIVVKSEIDLDLADLPAPVAAAIAARFPQAPLVDAELNQAPGKPTYYEVHIRNGGRLQELEVTEDGQITLELFNCPHQGR
jgi:ferric-dicitrate binding protein FerR (iron transport regulator)